MKIFDREYDFSFSDYEDVARLRAARKEASKEAQVMFDAADELMKKAMAEEDEDMLFAEYIDKLKAGCKVYADMIDGVLGDGTANEALGKVTDLDKLTDFWVEFNAALEEEAKNMEAKRKKFTAPRGKRGQ